MKKLLFSIVLILLSAISLFSQISKLEEEKFLNLNYNLNVTNRIDEILDSNSINENIKTISTKQLKTSDELDVELFPPVDIEPQIDLEKLRKCVIYPDSAKKNKIEGMVIVRILIDTFGVVIKTKIVQSDNEIFNDAVIKAVNTSGLYKPATQNDVPLKCWISILIDFKINYSVEIKY